MARKTAPTVNEKERAAAGGLVVSSPGWPGGKGLRSVRALWWTFCLALLLQTAAFAQSAGQDEHEIEATEDLLVEVILDRDSRTDMIIKRRGEELLVPLEELSAFAGASFAQSSEGLAVTTPVGSVVLEDSELERFDGQLWLATRTLEERFVAEVAWSETEYALFLDLPWRPEDASPAELEPVPVDITPDVLPPAASLSTIRFDSNTILSEHSTQVAAAAQLSGRVANGWWRAQLDTRGELGQSSDESPSAELEEWSWLRRFDRSGVMVGRQLVHTHPLLGGRDLSGIQFATTNQPFEVFSRTRNPRSLLSHEVEAGVLLEGSGPAAGIAELRIDGEVADRVPIRLDGSWRFESFVLRGRRVTDIEIYLYHRNNLAVPVEILDRSRAQSEFQMPKGAYLHAGGAGVLGNAADLSLEQDHGAAAFYQFRYGASERVTVEAAVEATDDGPRSVAGVVARLPGEVVMRAGLGAAEDAEAYDLSIYRESRRWQLRGLSRYEREGFEDQTAPVRERHTVDLTRRFRALDMSLVGRSQHDGFLDTEWLLPALAWYPNHRLALRARPVATGDYRVTGLWRPDRDTRIAAFFQEDLGIEIGRRFLDRYWTSLAAQRVGEQGSRYSGYVTWTQEALRWQPTWRIGADWIDGRLGYSAGAVTRLSRGLHAQADLQGVLSGGSTGVGQDPRLVLSLSADMAMANGQLVPVFGAMVREDRGGIAGRIRLSKEDDAALIPSSLGGISIALNGNVVARTNEDGEYFIGSLAPGTYQLDLDPEGLPIELRPDGQARFVGVAQGAVSRADFPVWLEFGAAGRVRASDRTPVPGARVEVRDADGDLHDVLRTDRFGLFRIDRLPAGLYRVRASHDDHGSGERRVEIRDRFLFGQDVDLSNESAE